MVRKKGELTNPFKFVSSEDNANDYVGKLMKVFILLIFLIIIIYSFFGELYDYLAPFHYLELQGVQITGLVLAHISLIGIRIAQGNMKNSWRIGIDFQNKTPLITNGLYKISRNPIYLFLMIGLIGLFMVMPNSITFAVTFGAFLILHVTMRLEEDFLYTQHGEKYELYKKKVRRLI